MLFSVFKQKLIVFSNEYVEYIKNILKYLKPNRKDAAYLIKWRPKEKLTNFLDHKCPIFFISNKFISRYQSIYVT